MIHKIHKLNTHLYVLINLYLYTNCCENIHTRKKNIYIYLCLPITFILETAILLEFTLYTSFTISNQALIVASDFWHCSKIMSECLEGDCHIAVMHEFLKLCSLLVN